MCVAFDYSITPIIDVVESLYNEKFIAKELKSKLCWNSYNRVQIHWSKCLVYYLNFLSCSVTNEEEVGICGF